LKIECDTLEIIFKIAGRQVGHVQSGKHGDPGESIIIIAERKKKTTHQSTEKFEDLEKQPIFHPAPGQ
jgi:hypothetical protein